MQDPPDQQVPLELPERADLPAPPAQLGYRELQARLGLQDPQALLEWAAQQVRQVLRGRRVSRDLAIAA